MSSPYILTEWIELDADPDLIKESESTGGPVLLKDRLLQKANTLNHNGRIYPTKVLAREVQKYSELVKSRRALGELDHPDSPIVELKNVALLVTDIRMEGNDVRGDIEILNTPSGAILKNLAAQRVKLGISSRGIGSLQKESDANIVQDDFELIAFDAVSSPSTPGAYLVTEARNSKVDRYNNLRAILYDVLGKDYFSRK